MTSIAKGVPCRFDLYWRIVFPKSHFCRVLDGGDFGQNMRGGRYGPGRTTDLEEGEYSLITRLTNCRVNAEVGSWEVHPTAR